MTLINIKRHQKIKALGYGTNDVGELLDDHIITIAAKIKKYYRRILENIRFLARQSLPFHGNQSNDSKSEEETNFHQLLLLRSLDHQDLVKWLNSGSKIQYASPEIQNEILKIMSLQVLREIAQNKELTFCILCVDENLPPHEEFTGMYPLINTSADHIVLDIKDILL